MTTPPEPDPSADPRPAPAQPLSDRLRLYLSHPALAPLWAAARTRLERSDLDVRGSVTLTVDEDAADRLSGLLGHPVAAGRVRVKLGDLDRALRRSAAGQGLVSVLGALDGRAVESRTATRRADADRWAAVWQELDNSLAAANLAAAPWVPGWIAELRRLGTLTRAGTDAATRAARHAATALGLLADTCAPRLRDPALPAELAERSTHWELGELATRVTGDAHGLDDTRIAAAILLRGAAQALDVPHPGTAAERRMLWQLLGVATDTVSGTVLAYGLRPPGADRWSAMMRERAELGLVTHLTAHELHRVGPVAFAPPGQPVYACENPQVLQAAAHARVNEVDGVDGVDGVDYPVLCLSGNPATVGTILIRALTDAGHRVMYHGDFDWAGITIANRVIALGAHPWRMSADDYRAAAKELDADHAVALSGPPVPATWEPALEPTMTATGLAVHEEAVLGTLIKDLHPRPQRGADLPERVLSQDHSRRLVGWKEGLP